MYHQCDNEPYDVDADGGLGQPINIDPSALRGIASAFLFALMVVGGGVSFFMNAMPLGFLCLAVGVVGFALVWITSVRR